MPLPLDLQDIAGAIDARVPPGTYWCLVMADASGKSDFLTNATDRNDCITILREFANRLAEKEAAKKSRR